MAYWHEQQKTRPVRLIVSNSENGRLQICIEYPDKSKGETDFKLFLSKWVKEGEPEMVGFYPQGWVELWPTTPITASSLPEALKLRGEVLAKLPMWIDEGLFTIKYSDIEFVEALYHSSNQFMARIYYWLAENK